MWLLEFESYLAIIWYYFLLTASIMVSSGCSKGLQSRLPTQKKILLCCKKLMGWHRNLFLYSLVFGFNLLCHDTYFCGRNCDFSKDVESIWQKWVFHCLRIIIFYSFCIFCNPKEFPLFYFHWDISLHKHHRKQNVAFNFTKAILSFNPILHYMTNTFLYTVCNLRHRLKLFLSAHHE